MLLHRLLAAALLVSTSSCAPQPVERTILLGAPIGRSDAQVSTPGAGGAEDPVDGGIDASAPRDIAPPDRPAAGEAAPIDSLAEGSSTADALSPFEAAAEVAVSQIALLVVGDPSTVSMGDNRWRIALESRGLLTRIVDDATVVDVTGIRLVVLSATCDSGALGSRYRDVMVPLISAEYQAYDSMGMTAGTGADLGLTQEAMLTILDPEHVMAAGLQGTIRVVSSLAGLAWGRPSASAERVATVQGEPDQTAIFGYNTGAMMATGPAPARRVGFFASDDAAESLGEAGRRLLGAALDWVLLP